MKIQTLLAAVLLALAQAVPAQTTANQTSNLPDWAIGPFTRASQEPVIQPNPDSVFDCPISKKPVNWEKAWTYNPAAAVKDGKIIVLYRAQQGPGNTCSRIGYATSEDGIHLKTEPTPVLFSAEDDQKSFEWSGNERVGGCEDPRLAESPDGTYIVNYSQYYGRSFRLGIATSKDLKTWTKQGATFAGTKWESKPKKSAAIVHEIKNGHLVAAKINGKYWMYMGNSAVLAATSDDLIHWVPLEDEKGNWKSVMTTRSNKYFDNLIVEVGPQAVLTDKGIILFYNGVNNHGEKANPDYPPGGYCGGEALFDRNDPTKLITRLDKPFIQPELPWEKNGLYKDGTTFIEGLVLFKNQWFLYYGASDHYVGVATAPYKP